jgi:hypothetical protein
MSCIAMARMSETGVKATLKATAALISQQHTQASTNHGALARCVTKADSHHLAVHRERTMQVRVYS